MTDKKEQIRETLAYYLDLTLPEMKDELTLNELELDEVDIEELLLTLEDELGIPLGNLSPTLDIPSAPTLENPITPETTIKELVEYIDKRLQA